MWRESKVVREILRAIMPLFGACIGFLFVGLASFDLGMTARVVSILLRTLLSNVGVIVATFLLLELKRRYAARPASVMPEGPKFLVSVIIHKGKSIVGRDEGVLRLGEGFLQYEGLETAFSIPRDRIEEFDAARNTIRGRDLGVAIQFQPQRQLESEEDWRTFEHHLRDFESRPSGGEFVPPPSTKPPSLDWKVHEPQLGFWMAFGLGVVALSFLMGEDRPSRTILSSTFTATCLVATIKPAIQLRRLFKAAAVPPTANDRPASLGPTPLPESPPEQILRVQARGKDECR